MKEVKYNLEDVKNFLKEQKEYNYWNQIYDSRNVVGDPMENIYDKDGVQIDACYHYGYYEIFGLTDEDFKEIEDFMETKEGGEDE